MHLHLHLPTLMYRSQAAIYCTCMSLPCVVNILHMHVGGTLCSEHMYTGTLCSEHMYTGTLCSEHMYMGTLCSEHMYMGTLCSVSSEKLKFSNG